LLSNSFTPASHLYGIQRAMLVEVAVDHHLPGALEDTSEPGGSVMGQRRDQLSFESQARQAKITGDLLMVIGVLCAATVLLLTMAP
jgi:hypothetical protein